MIKQNNFHMEVYNIHFSRNLHKYELFLKYLFTVELDLDLQFFEYISAVSDFVWNTENHEKSNSSHTVKSKQLWVFHKKAQRCRAFIMNIFYTSTQPHESLEVCHQTALERTGIFLLYCSVSRFWAESLSQKNRIAFRP